MDTMRRITTAILVAWSSLTLPLWGSPVAAQTVGVCGVFLDRTWSVDPEHRLHATAAVQESLMSFVTTFDCDLLVLGQFADEGPWAPRRTFKVPRPPILECTEPRSSAKGARLLLDNFSGFQELHSTQARTACDAQQAEARVRSEMEMKAFRDSTSTFFSTIKPTDAPTRTALVALVHALLAQQIYRALAIVTDGIEEVTRPIPPLTVPTSTTLALITVPATPQSGGYDATLAASQEWTAAIPSIHVIPYTNLPVTHRWNQPRRHDHVTLAEAHGHNAAPPGPRARKER